MSLLSDLAPDIEAIRADAYGCAGTRPYRLFRVRVGWSGGEPGRGTREERERVELGCGECCGKVTPAKVILSGAWARSQHGVVEQGFAVVEGLAPSYREADLVDYGQLAEGEASFYEIRLDGDGASVRRYLIDGPPQLLTNPYGWVLKLRSHEPQGVFPPAQVAP